MQSIWTPEVLIHGAEFLLLLGGGWVGLKIKQAQSDNRADFLKAIGDVRDEQNKAKDKLVEQQNRVKEELVEAQNGMRQDLDAKHAENRGDLRAHVASDEQQFKFIGQKLERIEKIVGRGRRT